MVSIEKVLDIIDIYVTATGNREIITVDHMKKMKVNAIMCNMGSSDYEIDMNGLAKEKNVIRTTVKPNQVDKYTFDNGKSVIILAEGT